MFSQRRNVANEKDSGVCAMGLQLHGRINVGNFGAVLEFALLLGFRLFRHLNFLKLDPLARVQQVSFTFCGDLSSKLAGVCRLRVAFGIIEYFGHGEALPALLFELETGLLLEQFNCPFLLGRVSHFLHVKVFWKVDRKEVIQFFIRSRYALNVSNDNRALRGTVLVEDLMVLAEVGEDGHGHTKNAGPDEFDAVLRAELIVRTKLR
mmetsp:Transcript_19775/g.48351  ORF Transcript_19775/g.48351 Transcript_19775/m.48351 type:complete len:207 (+) Transcript_19775:2854-3474(+)